jgi:hypothetical protein
MSYHAYPVPEWKGRFRRDDSPEPHSSDEEEEEEEEEEVGEEEMCWVDPPEVLGLVLLMVSLYSVPLCDVEMRAYLSQAMRVSFSHQLVEAGASREMFDLVQIQRVFACSGGLLANEGAGLVRSNASMLSRVDTLRLLWYISVYGFLQGKWEVICEQAFPCGQVMTAAMCQDEWQRLLDFAVDSVPIVQEQEEQEEEEEEQQIG